ncbi:MAG: cell wall hydrolase [Clostridiales bacterium]|nr:cell wall hydrolase [Clostridiales bacterium]
MKKSGFLYVCWGIMLLSVILTGIVCGADAAETNQQEAVACVAEEGEGAGESIALTQAEKTLLARLVSTECQGEPYLCRVAAAAVVLNRVKDDGFPSSVVNVVFSAGAFSSVEKGELGQNITDEDLQVSLEAVCQAAGGEDPTGGALYFAREDDVRAEGISVTFRAGGMIFGW